MAAPTVPLATGTAPPPAVVVPVVAPAAATAAWRAIGVLLGCFLLAWANWAVPVLRTTSALVNTLVFVVALLLPAVAAALAFRERQPYLRLVALCALVPIALVSLLLALVAALDAWQIAARGADLGFVRQRVATVGAHALHVYRTDGGATTGHGIVVRHERALLPGLRVVREVHRAYPADDTRVTVLPSGAVRFDGRAPVPLRPYVVF